MQDPGNDPGYEYPFSLDQRPMDLTEAAERARLARRLDETVDLTEAVRRARRAQQIGEGLAQARRAGVHRAPRSGWDRDILEPHVWHIKWHLIALMVAIAALYGLIGFQIFAGN
ncbi:MAG TPA: hypothetical protein VFR23_11570 [Jiangellaceae bacterium]|nr:hypothetical protein [Jiangellaceae bacterium]